MYGETFGEEWDDLDRSSCSRRAYALGVASVIGHGRPDEYERIKQAADTTYDKTIIELAYNEGRRLAASEYNDSTSPETVWEHLVEKTTPSSSTKNTSRISLPPALDRPVPGRIGKNDRKFMALPELLRKP